MVMWGGLTSVRIWRILKKTKIMAKNMVAVDCVSPSVGDVEYSAPMRCVSHC